VRGLIRNSDNCFFVITGLVPVIPIHMARRCQDYRDCRDKPWDKPGNDELITRTLYDACIGRKNKKTVAMLDYARFDRIDRTYRRRPW
jgi:hypothetical protein